jgi:hypothetical protein
MVSAQVSCPTRFTSEKVNWYPFIRRPDGPQNRFGRIWRRGNILSLLGIEPRIIDLVAWSLRPLSCTGSRIYVRVFKHLRSLFQITELTPCSKFLQEKLWFVSHSSSSHIMEYESLLPCSPEPATCPYFETGELNQHL